MEERHAFWMFVHAIVMLAMTILSIVLHSVLPVVCGMWLSLSIFLYQNRATWLQLKPLGGFANHVTLLRFLGLSATLLLMHWMSSEVFVLCLVLVIIADGIDGYLARKLKLETAFGEIFDTETDAFLAISLCVLIAMRHPDGVWILIPGVLRYVFTILYRLNGWRKRARPKMPETKAFAVVFFLSLLTPWIFKWDMAQGFMISGSLLVCYSFAREFYLIGKNE